MKNYEITVEIAEHTKDVDVTAVNAVEYTIMPRKTL
jgi:hypothetical protein